MPWQKPECSTLNTLPCKIWLESKSNNHGKIEYKTLEVE